MKTFKVVQCNPNSKNGFVTKLQSEEIVSNKIFGDKTKRVTYYISATNEVPVGTEVSESDLFPMYKVVEHDMVNPSTSEVFKAKWLSCN